MFFFTFLLSLLRSMIQAFAGFAGETASYFGLSTRATDTVQLRSTVETSSNETPQSDGNGHHSRAHEAQKDQRSYEDEYHEPKRRLDEVQQTHERALAHHQQLYEQLRADKDTLERSWKVESERLRDRVDISQKQLQHERSLREEDRKLLEIRRVELEVAQAFLGSADTVSGEEISAMVQALNSHIYQLAATIAESGDFLDDYQCDQATVETAAEYFGQDLCRLMHASRKQDPDRREFLIQIALQVALLWACSHIVDRWAPKLVYSDVESTWNTIQSLYPQRTSGRWKVMTRSHLKYANPALVSVHATGLCARAMGLVMLVAGFKPVTTNPQLAQSTVINAYSASLEDIVNAAILLDRVTGEQVISQHANLVMMSDTDGQMFNPEWMEDMYGDGEGLVACSLEFGLQLSVRGPKGQMVSSTIPLKTKVVLVSSLCDRERSSTEVSEDR